MKRTVLRLTTALLVLTLCVGLTGCGALDSLRARHGSYQNADTMESFTVGDTVYRRIESNGMLAPSIDFEGSPLLVTTKDVPVLLSFFLGDALYTSEDGIFAESLSTGVLYCRGDHYDNINRQLTEGFEPTGYCYEYTVYDDITESFKSRTYRLSAAEEEKVLSIVQSELSVTVPANASVDYDYAVDIMSCDDTTLFREYVFSIGSLNDTYYIFGELDSDESWSITVPEAYNSLFHLMLKAPREFYEQLAQMKDEW